MEPPTWGTMININWEIPQIWNILGSLKSRYLPINNAIDDLGKGVDKYGEHEEKHFNI